MTHRMLLTILSLGTGFILAACVPSPEDVNATAPQAAAASIAAQTAQAPTATLTLTPTLTATITATPTLSPSPTRTATITPTPTPRLMAAVLMLDDLPPEFRAVSPAELEDLLNKIPENAVGYGFLNDENIHLVLGYLIPYPSRSEQLTLDAILPSMDDTLALGFGAKTTPEAIPDLEDIGESRVGFSMVNSMENPLRMDVVIFRQGEVGEFLFITYPDGDDLTGLAGELARILDGRILKLMGRK